REVLDGVLADRSIAAVVHFAARCYVGESVTDPRLYYRKNLVTTLGLVEALVDHGVAGVLFSSTCSVYGETGHDDLPEDLPRAPVNPYGRTKAAIEWLLEDFSCAYPLRHVILRYFNAAGADPDGELGEDHDPETHLVPLVIREALAGGGALSVFGTDYPTPDGTCIRDYIHVTDLADAHVRGVRHLLEGGESDVLNLGTGRGHSVLDVIRAVEARAGREIPHRLVDRRPGDPARLVARPGRAREATRASRRSSRPPTGGTRATLRDTHEAPRDAGAALRRRLVRSDAGAARRTGTREDREARDLPRESHHDPRRRGPCHPPSLLR
ncbi:MAG: UDP-glucose 4-epimerase GalE, partial [Planctomycetota bacterium]